MFTRIFLFKSMNNVHGVNLQEYKLLPNKYAVTLDHTLKVAVMANVIIIHRITQFYNGQNSDVFCRKLRLRY